MVQMAALANVNAKGIMEVFMKTDYNEIGVPAHVSYTPKDITGISTYPCPFCKNSRVGVEIDFVEYTFENILTTVRCKCYFCGTIGPMRTVNSSGMTNDALCKVAVSRWNQR